jgi:hypothetical protein
MTEMASIAKAAVQKSPQSTLLNENHETRQEEARRRAEAVGIRWPGTILPPGTALYESGVDKLTADRARWAKLPSAGDALPAVAAALEAEDRQDVTLPTAELRLHETNGRLYRVGKEKIAPSGYNSHAFRQLVGQVPGMRAGEAPRGFASALLYLSDAERAEIVNRRIHKADKTALLRTKLTHNGQRVVRAVLSERYADVTDLHVAAAVQASLNGGAQSIKLDYRPGEDASQFELIFPSKIPVKTFKVGDLHYGYVEVRNNEIGSGSIEIVPGLFRAACANLTLSSGEGVRVSIRHVGDAHKVMRQMRAAIQQAVAQIEPLVHDVEEAAGIEVDGSIVDLMSKIAKKFSADSSAPTRWLKRFEASYTLPGYQPTLWGVTSAITEAAQSAGSWRQQQAEEEIAAVLIHKGLGDLKA